MLPTACQQPDIVVIIVNNYYDNSAISNGIGIDLRTCTFAKVHAAVFVANLSSRGGSIVLMLANPFVYIPLTLERWF